MAPAIPDETQSARVPPAAPDFRFVRSSLVEEVSADNFAENVSSKGVKAWAIRHEVSVQHQDVLVERLRRIISELASL